MKTLKLLLTILAFFNCCGISMAEDYVVETGQFEKLKINGNMSVIYKCLPDSTGYARYSAPPGNENIFQFSTKKDGTLKIQPDGTNWNRTDLPVVYVYSDYLSYIESASELPVIIRNPASCSNFKLKLIGNGSITADNIKSNDVSASLSTGNGSIYLSGRCDNANFSLVGSGLISADRLAADNVKCNAVGTGSIGCWAVDNLTIKCVGSTKIYYKGSPNIKKSGGGKLFELPEDDEYE